MNTNKLYQYVFLLLSGLILLVPLRESTAAGNEKTYTHVPSKHQRSVVVNRNLLPTSKPLFLIFEKAGCGQCNDFRNNVLAMKAVRHLLKKFEVVSLDVMDDRTVIIAPDGRCTTATSLFSRYDLENAPAIAFFDNNGSTVFTTDAPQSPQGMMHSLHAVLKAADETGQSDRQMARTSTVDRHRQNRPPAD